MDFVTIRSDGATLHPHPPDRLPESGFVWCDCRHDEARAWLDPVRALTGIVVHEVHVLDAANLAHSSYFDSAADYEMIVFRGLAAPPDEGSAGGRFRLRTHPATFFLMPLNNLSEKLPICRKICSCDKSSKYE